MPAAPAKAPPIKKVSMIMRSTSIPIAAAVSGSSAVARIAFPQKVRVTKKMQAKYQRNRDPDDKQILACDIDFALEMKKFSDDVEAREHVGEGKNLRSL